MNGIVNYARSRFVTVFCTAAAGTTLAVGAFVFTPTAERWLGVGVGAGCAVLVLCAFAVTGRGTFQRLLDAALLPVAAWTVVSALTIERSAHAPQLVQWLGFSAGAAIAGLGLIGLLAHEFGLERDLEYATERIWGLTPHPEHPQPAPADDYAMDR